MAELWRDGTVNIVVYRTSYASIMKEHSVKVCLKTLEDFEKTQTPNDPAS